MSSPKTTPDYEVSDAVVADVVKGVGVLVAGIALSFGVASLIYRGVKAGSSATGPDLAFTHGAESESSIDRDWREQDELVRQHLGGYRWVDREKGTVSIPIDRAMELMVTEANNPGKTP